MTPSQSQNILIRQISNNRNQLKAKTQEGQEQIKNKDRSSKLNTNYKQLVNLDDSLCILLPKRANILRAPEWFKRHEAERLHFLQTLNTDWLPDIHQETHMTDQQNQSVQLASDAKPTAANTSQSVVGVSQRTVENINRNKDNDSKASSDERANGQKTGGSREKHCIKNEVEPKMSSSWKGKNLKWRSNFLKKKVNLNWNTRKKLLTQEHHILMTVQPLVFEVDHHSIGKPQRTKMFLVCSIARTQSPTCATMVSSVQKPGSTTIIPG